MKEKLHILSLGLMVFTLVLVSGCGGAKSRPERSAITEKLPLPQLPVFLDGPMSVLLTNVGGFSAHAILELPSPADHPKRVSGELLERGGKLLFAMDPPAGENKRSSLAGISFLWDVATRSGCILSEPMQGYAPVSSPLPVTNVVFQPVAGRPASETVEGHRCDLTQAIVTAGDGAEATFQLWKARDLQGLPIRIVSSKAPSLTLSLSKIRLEPPPAPLFLPPDDFVKYDNAEAMMGELAVRQAVAKKKAKSNWRQETDFQQEDRMGFGR